MIVLGISAFFHDSAAAIIQNGKIISAAQEERFSRTKHDSNFPQKAILSCLAQSGFSTTEIDAIVFYDKPLIKFERLLDSHFSTAPKSFAAFRKAMPVWLKEKLLLKNVLLKELQNIGFNKRVNSKIYFSEHHLSHAASAFYPSPFDNAAILTVDGVGEWTTTSIANGNGTEIEVLKEIHFPHSLGLLYSAFTYYCGFKVNSGEYKLMGLAPYGKPVYKGLILTKLIKVHNDGSFNLNLEYFDFIGGLSMINKKFEWLFGKPPRKMESEMDPFYMDIAASIQAVTEEVIEKLSYHALEITGCSNLCMAGGVALNCTANGKLYESLKTTGIWIQPASGDAGGALGAALAWYYSNPACKNRFYEENSANSVYLGPEFSNKEIEDFLIGKKANYEYFETSDIVKRAAISLSNGQALGWFQGRMEFGPRALGNRSIIADPRGKNVKENLNAKIKFRESFRPFAPAVLKDKCHEYFSGEFDDPYMLFSRIVTEKSKAELVPAVVHVDLSARVQTVSESDNRIFYELLVEFNRLTNCPMLVNTSFNIRGEPPVCSPEDAYECFMSCGLDVLVIGNYFLEKKLQPRRNYRVKNIQFD